MAGKRVLIVDDDLFFRIAIRDALEAAGYEAAVAADGTEGLAKAESLRPDVILLDVVMPGPDGYEVCARLKANPATSHIPVVFMTAVENLSLNRIAHQAGAAVCIAKPLRPEALVMTIESVVDSAERHAMPKGSTEEDGPGCHDHEGRR